MKRVAVLFDNTVRPETTGLYVRRALGVWLREGHLTTLEHLLPSELDRVHDGEFDLYLIVDDGLNYELPETLRPAVWWAIDTHLGFERCLRRAKQTDWTFAAQRNGAQRLQASGVDTAIWLPLACDPEIHGRRQVSVQYDIAFIGNEVGAERRRLLDLIGQRYQNVFRGQAYLEEMAAIYSSSRIVFNRSVADDVNMRVFEALASGALLVTNRLNGNGLNELFEEDCHYVAYESDDELLDKLAFYLAHDAARDRIARAGRDAVLAAHTYRHRVDAILARLKRPSSCVVRAEVAGKPDSYFEFSRPDVLALVPNDCRRVLDVGCGAGGLGDAIKRRQPAAVVGIELSPSAAARARQVLDEVLSIDIEQAGSLAVGQPFDCIICADVLEHLREPRTVLQSLRDRLSPDGVLVASLPNVRNHTVVQSLLAGNWTYESAGLLDADHVRFFTRREIEKLFFRCGLAIEEFGMIPGDGYQEWLDAGSPRQVHVGGLQVRAGSREEAAEFYAYQFLLRARPVAQPDRGLTSIVIVTHNQLAYTRQCVESIQLRTDEPYELIFVDNGSTDGTPSYLRSIPNATVLINETNRGFPAAANQGLQAAHGDNLLLLNNDVVVTTGWLWRLLETLHSDATIGLVGPVSNNVSGGQQIEVGYSQLAELDGWAWDRQWRLTPAMSHGVGVSIVESDRLVGFCLLMKREVLDTIGLLDERFGIGNFEDDDFCRRARDAGYRTVVASKSFVHHFGSVTFRDSGIDFAGLLERNQRLYEEKWARDAQPKAAETSSAVTLRRPRPNFVAARADDGSLRLEPNRIRLSLCMIVRDNAATIRPCLESIQPWVDEMVVVDTGSIDETPTICEEFGARVFHWPWRDDFSAARNQSLDCARGEWIFWMDSDDTIPTDCGRKLREMVAGEHSEDIFGYVMQVHCPGRDRDEVTVVDHVKLFRNRPDLCFEFRIHEQVLPSIRRAGGDVAFTDIHVVHSGSDPSPEGRQRKIDRDLRILQMELEERPDHPFALFNLGMTHSDAEQHEEAIRYLQRSIDVAQAGESHLRKAHALLVNSLMQLGQADDALVRCERALADFEGDKELLFRRAMGLHQLGRLDEAVSCYRQVLVDPIDRHFMSIDKGIVGYKARHNLALVLEEQGRLEEARVEWVQITRERPTYRGGWRGLGEVLLSMEEPEQIDEVLREINCVVPELDCERLRLHARAAEVQGKPLVAIARFRAAIEQFPADIDLWQDLCRLLFTQAEPQETASALSELVRLAPHDPAAHHNLGTTFLRLRRWEHAIHAFRRSLSLRPDHSETAQGLIEAREQLNCESAPAEGL